MKKYILSLLAMLAMALCAYAQADSHIIGHVIDSKTGEHLPFITIRIMGTNIITSTDGSGHYKFTNIKAGQYTLEASSVGYITIEKNVDLKENSPANVSFTLAEDNLLLEQIVVT